MIPRDQWQRIMGEIQANLTHMDSGLKRVRRSLAWLLVMVLLIGMAAGLAALL